MKIKIYVKKLENDKRYIDFLSSIQLIWVTF